MAVWAGPGRPAPTDRDTDVTDESAAQCLASGATSPACAAAPLSCLPDLPVASVRFNPKDMGSFVRLPTGLASILLAIDRIEPAELGASIVALLGNPTGTPLRGARLALRYGCSGAGRQDSAADRTGQVSVVVDRELPPGSWTRIAFRLPDVAPEEIDSMEVTVAAAVAHELDAIALCTG